MKREIKTVLAIGLAAILLLLWPVFLEQARFGRERELMNRKPRLATLKFRQKVAGATEIKVFFDVSETDTPFGSLLAARKPNLVLRGEEAAQLVRALHFEWESGQSLWRVHSGPFAGAIFPVTALEFSADGKTLADLRVGLYGGHRLQSRWYGKADYIGDSRLLIASRDFLERKFGHPLDGR